MLETNVDRLLKARAQIDKELHRHKTALTILFTDVVGSTAYYDRFGDTSGLAMLQRHADLASQAVAEFGGRVIKIIGDSVMAEFPDPAAGLRAAVAIQRRLVELNGMLEEWERIELRIGINHGPLFRHDNDIYGDAVNLAARITKRTGPGQILVSRMVREATRESGEFCFGELGKVTIEGKAEKEDIFEVVWTDADTYAEIRESLTAALQRGELVSPGLKLEELVQPPGGEELATPALQSPGQNQNPAAAKSKQTAYTLFTSIHDAAITTRYEILQELGRGGMGVVYKARDRETGDLVALKVLKDDFAADDGIRERFKNELRLARKITHKNVCRIHEFYRSEQTLYISMEYVDGESLRSILERCGALPLHKCLNLALQICAGLTEAHEEGVVHRDMKPENLMIDAAGHLKIMDFGIARSMDASATILPGAVVGTPAYMSPEQAEGKKTDARTDIYTLGLILYEMTTGQRAFVADTPVAVALKQIRETPPAPRTLVPGMPIALEKLIVKCLAKDRNKRFQSVEELEEEIAEQARSLPMEAAQTLRTVPLNKTELLTPEAEEAENAETLAGPRQPISRGMLIAAGAIAALVIAIGVVKYGGTKRSVPASTPDAAVAATAPPAPAEPAPASVPAPSARPSARKSEPPPAAAASPQPNAGRDQISVAPIKISTDPPGAQVLIDGKEQAEETPFEFSLPQGEHKVMLRKEGFRTTERTVEIAGSNPPMQIEMTPNPIAASEPAPAPPKATTVETGTGRIVVSTRPAGAKIVVDGEETSYRSPVDFSLAAGKHTIEVQHDGFETETREVRVTNNSVSQFEIALKQGGVKKRKRFLIR